MDLDSSIIKSYCLEILKEQDREVNTEGDLL